MRELRRHWRLLFLAAACMLASALIGCAMASHGSTVDRKYSVPAIVTVAPDVPAQLQPYALKCGQVLGYYGLKLDKTDDPRAFQLHLAYSEDSGDPKVSIWLTQNGETVLEVFAKPRRWVPWGSIPSDKDKLLEDVAGTAVQELDNRLNDFMDMVHIDNEPHEDEKSI